MTELREAVRRHCIDAGFANARFSKAEFLIEEGKELKDWLNNGHHATMQWMESSFDRRVDPSLLLKDVKSIISLSYLYDTPYEHSEASNIPKISRYAWGTRDYHKIIKKKLKHLCNEIESLGEGFITRAYIDDGPVMDKTWAVRSGLGWMGKHTNVIDKDHGSFFFIGTVLTNIELEPDRPVEDLCKDCSLCINACPTGAIHKEYKLDSNLCISYQTIENRAEEITAVDLHGWIFGCDVCQDVCPFNRPGTFCNDEHFIPNHLAFGKTYDELITMSEEQYRTAFSGTPIMSAKYSGWKRNLLKAREESGRDDLSRE
jgi:epoxyqueuosine reductase